MSSHPIGIGVFGVSDGFGMLVLVSVTVLVGTIEGVGFTELVGTTETDGFTELLGTTETDGFKELVGVIGVTKGLHTAAGALQTPNTLIGDRLVGILRFPLTMLSLSGTVWVAAVIWLAKHRPVGEPKLEGAVSMATSIWNPPVVSVIFEPATSPTMISTDVHFSFAITFKSASLQVLESWRALIFWFSTIKLNAVVL